MRDLRADLKGLWRGEQTVRRSARGRAVMFVGVRDGDGATSVAASFALHAARRAAKAAWLVDLDLLRNSAFKGFASGVFKGVGPPGRPFDAGLGQAPFYAVRPRFRRLADEPARDKLLTAHAVGGAKLLVTRFRDDRLDDGDSVVLRAAPDWWAALRGAADWIVVDAPALSRSSAALAVADEMDAVYLVATADKARPEELREAEEEIEAHDGRVKGLVFNRRRWDARLADRFGG